ncbi:MAG: hypothetical protein ACQESO_01295 [Bacillota bacterium]
MNDNLISIAVIAPQVTRETLNLKDDDYLGALFYPFVVYHMEAELKRLLGKSKLIDDILAVDLSRGVAARADSIPETEQWEVSPQAIVPSLINDAQALKVVRRRFLKFLMRKHLILLVPDMYPIEQVSAHKIIWVGSKQGSGKYLIDSLSGKYDEVK